MRVIADDLKRSPAFARGKEVILLAPASLARLADWQKANRTYVQK
jgi:hypothetical protein